MIIIINSGGGVIINNAVGKAALICSSAEAREITREGAVEECSAGTPAPVDRRVS